MTKIKLTPKTITLWLAGFSLIPRFLSSGFGIGTLSILLFWSAILTILPDYIDEYETKKIPLNNLNYFTKCVFVLSSIIVFLSIILSLAVNSNNKTVLIEVAKDFSFIVYPLICIGWINANDKNKFNYLLNVIILTVGLFSVLKLPSIILEIIPKALNEHTASVAAALLSLVYYDQLIINGNDFLGETFNVSVGAGCSSAPQIIACYYSLLIFFICCKLSSKFYLFIILVFSTLTAFYLNCVRIAMLGYMLIIDRNDYFDFWHTGGGSLTFSMIVMGLSCFYYYYFWNKENGFNLSDES